MSERISFEVETNITSATTDVKKFGDEVGKANTKLKDTKVNVSKVVDEAGKLSKSTKRSLGNFRLMGVSMNDVTKNFAILGDVGKKVFTNFTGFFKNGGRAVKVMFGGKARVGIKLFFAVLKSGIAATGIGLLLLAFGSLVAYILQAKEKAGFLKEAFRGISATVKVLGERLAGVGHAIGLFFTGNFSEAADEIRNAFSGIKEDIVETYVEMKTEEQTIKDLASASRSYEKGIGAAKNEMKKLRDESEDTSTHEMIRQNKLREAQALELKWLKKKRRFAEDSTERAKIDAEIEAQKYNAIKEMTQLQESIQADKDAAKKEADDKTQASTDRMIELQDELDVLMLDKERDRAIKSLQIQERKEIESVSLMENAEKLKAKIRDKYMKLRESVDVKFKKKVEYTEKEITDATISSIGNLAGAMGKAAGDNKELAIASSLINTYMGITSALGSGPPPANFIQAAAVGVAGFVAVEKIASQDVPGTDTAAKPSMAAPPNPVVTGNFALTGSTDDVDMKAIVVADEMSDQQNQLASIRRRAAI